MLALLSTTAWGEDSRKQPAEALRHAAVHYDAVHQRKPHLYLDHKRDRDDRHGFMLGLLARGHQAPGLRALRRAGVQGVPQRQDGLQRGRGRHRR